jgi:hypothetical protein
MIAAAVLALALATAVADPAPEPAEPPLLVLTDRVGPCTLLDRAVNGDGEQHFGLGVGLGLYRKEDVAAGLAVTLAAGGMIEPGEDRAGFGFVLAVKVSRRQR